MSLTEKPVICIDPGHGDGTGIIYRGAIEDEIVLDIAKDAARIIEEDFDVKVVLTRNNGVGLSQNARGKISNCANANLVISLHVNGQYEHIKRDDGSEYWAPLVSQHGYMGFYWPGNEAAKSLASIAYYAMPKELQRSRVEDSIFSVAPNDWTRNAYNVLVVHKATTLLMELGFATNDDDRRALMSLTTKRKIVHALEHVVAYYLESNGV